jgi:hypothetical protein
MTSKEEPPATRTTERHSPRYHLYDQTAITEKTTELTAN